MGFSQNAVLIVLGSGLTAVLAVLGWVVVRVLQLSVRIASLEAETRARFAQIGINCSQRLDWIRAVEKRQDEIADNVAQIKGLLEADRRN